MRNLAYLFGLLGAVTGGLVLCGYGTYREMADRAH
jgi:hypothetical protein